MFVDCQDFQHNRKDYYVRGHEQELADLLSSVPDPAKACDDDAAPGGSGLSEASTADPEKAEDVPDCASAPESAEA